MQLCQAGAADKKCDATNETHARFERRRIRSLSTAKQQVTENQQQQREGISKIAEEIEADVGDPGTDRAAKVMHRMRLAAARVRPSLVAPVIGNKA